MTLSAQVKLEECSPVLPWGLYTISQRTPSPDSRTPSPRFGHASSDVLCAAKLPGQTFVFPPYQYNGIPNAKPFSGREKTEPTAHKGDPASSAPSPALFCSSPFFEAPLHTTPSPKPLPQPHIPRPPNAFMIFRSHYLKLPAADCSDRRQQNLSRLAGTAWNSLTPEAKAKWHEEAAQALLKHQQDYPDYKFTPAPRGSRRLKNAARVNCEATGKGKYKDTRDKYMGLSGTHRRQRNAKREHRVESSNRIVAPMAIVAKPQPTAPSPARLLSAPSCSAVVDDSPALPPCFPQVSYPHIIIPRRPSTSLGFSSSTDKFHRGIYHKRSLTRPSSAASSDRGLSGALYSLDIASAYTGLESVSLPPTPLPSPVEQFANPWATSDFVTAPNRREYRRQPDVSIGPTDIGEPFTTTPSFFQQMNQPVVNDAYLEYFPPNEEQCKLHMPLDNAAFNPPCNFGPSEWAFTNQLGDGSDFLCGTYTA